MRYHSPRTVDQKLRGKKTSSVLARNRDRLPVQRWQRDMRTDDEDRRGTCSGYERQVARLEEYGDLSAGVSDA